MMTGRRHPPNLTFINTDFVPQYKAYTNHYIGNILVPNLLVFSKLSVIVLECLGYVETVSGEGRFVVKADTVPEINETVFDDKGKRMGTVKRVFGPVEGPYVTVNAENGIDLTAITGMKIYFKGEVKNAKGSRKHWRSG